MLIFELQNSFPNTAPYKNILTNSYHYSFITSEHYRHNASKQLFNKSACGPIKYNLLYINAIITFLKPRLQPLQRWVHPFQLHQT